ncbi:1,4-dihydroxy-2-naphthoyl-CoA synthase [Natronorubrum aibiense]|uniref:1,4-dihydroxy-2-naphthoyl-CoA synthase n=1 Tax=Natronorubrum aibiense TaxID=348826 RepID=A0A5P9P6M6_9EURY|nr:1,4-dihydroxy-2-naphthoyl-CoA synthase [Natronorubrum aibiense]QFU83788.1 1,4-dihydroxy-2-naphthoyl-CoA synthase [Natronorubrum aibiense]
MVSELFDDTLWEPVAELNDEFTDITYHRAVDSGTVRIAFDRPDVRNAFRPGTVDELYDALDHAKRQTDVGCILLTGNGPSSKDGGWAFCSGGDQTVRGEDGYQYEGDEESEAQSVRESQGDSRSPSEVHCTSEDASEDASGQGPRARASEQGRLHILEVQRLIRHIPKVVVCVVPGWAVGGGHSLHVVCDLTLASEEHAKFLQTDPDVASYDAGFGSAYLAKQIGQKKAREVFFLGKTYSADEAAEMGMVNEVVPHEELEETALEWGDRINAKSPTAMRMLKYAFNMTDDGLVGQQVFAGEATRLGYMTDEAKEGRDAFVEGRDPEFDEFPWHY